MYVQGAEKGRKNKAMVENYTIHVPDPVLIDLDERLGRTRWPDQLEGVGWDYGTELSYLKELCAYWKDEFDWRAQEAFLNSFSQFREEINGLRVHFLHVRSCEAEALPLLITHGWPGSIVEFHKIIGPLTDPVAHGGRAEDAFHVICPSLPGYAFSEAPRLPGFGAPAVAQTLATLMAKLGYGRYGVQGGDWGAIVSSYLPQMAPGCVCGVHLNMVVAGPPAGTEDPLAGLEAKEMSALADMGHFRKYETGYQRIQETKPQSLGYALHDSPTGLAGWIVEKFRTWSDSDGDVESCFTKDELLTNIMLYWVTGSITSSLRLYYESARGRSFSPDRVEVPTGVAVFPKELYRPPRAWAEAQYNIQRWTEMPSGGHFPALEEPVALVEELRGFFRHLR